MPYDQIINLGKDASFLGESPSTEWTEIINKTFEELVLQYMTDDIPYNERDKRQTRIATCLLRYFFFFVYSQFT